VGKSSEQGRTEIGEKSRSERKTQNDTTDRGGGISHKRDRGTRRSARREVSRTLDKMRSPSLNTSLNVVGLYAKAAKDAGAVRELYIDDLLVTPIGRSQRKHKPSTAIRIMGQRDRSFSLGI
jgi:hypothetical protein